MNHHLKVGLPALVLVAAIIACTMPVEQVPPPDAIQTAAALTLQAVLTSSVTSSAPTPSITTTSSPRVTGTASPIGSPTTTITPTYSVPIATVRESTNCRTGPGEEYDVIVTYLTGKELEIAGRYDPGNFWLVKSNESPTGTCWLWGQYVDVAGSYWAVSSVTPPPTSTARPPQAPTIIEWIYHCEGRAIVFTVNWRDNANNETGYRIFRNGEPLVELPANSTTFGETFSPPEGLGASYAIQVYGPSGSTVKNIGSMRCD